MQKKQKSYLICHIISGDLWAGAEAQIFYLLNELKKNRFFKIKVIILNNGTLADKLRKINISTIVIDEKKENFLKIIKKTRAIFNKECIHIIHSHRYKENIIAFIASIGIGNRSYIFHTIHGLVHTRKAYKAMKMLMYTSMETIIRKYFVHTVITVSRELYLSLSKEYYKIPYLCISNGIPLTDREVCKPKHHYEKIKTIAVAGRLVPVKNFSSFLRAIPIIADQYDNIKFVVAGDGPEMNKLNLLSQKLGIENLICFKGHIDNMEAFWESIDVFVLCSLHEGLSMALLEAMANGVLVAATAVGGNVEVVKDGINGVLISEGTPKNIADNCIRILKMQKEKRKKMSEEARETVKNRYSIAACAEKYSELYYDTLVKGTSIDT